MKVFCVGTNKTGTTSLTVATEKLGFSPVPTDKSYGLYLGAGLNHSKENLKKMFHHFELRGYTFDFFRDIPYSLKDTYKWLYEMFPDEFYILTLRDPEAWFDSVLRWIEQINGQTMYNWIWGIEVIEKNKDNVIKRFNKRNDEIISFFENKDNFLTLNIEDKDNFRKLSEFLKTKIIDEPFPHKNHSKNNKSIIKQNSYAPFLLK